MRDIKEFEFGDRFFMARITLEGLVIIIPNGKIFIGKSSGARFCNLKKAMEKMENEK